MGAEAFMNTVRATSAEEGFRELFDRATMEYGSRSYNGTINTCRMGRCQKRYDKFTEKNRKEASNLIQAKDYGYKGTADYIDLGVVEYKVITLKKVNVSGEAPVIRIKHVVREQEFRTKGKFIKDFDTKKEADDYALSLAIKNNKPYDVFKEGVLISGNDRTSTIEMEVKIYKSKPSLKPMPNRKIIDVHEYVFYGWASS